MLFIGLMGKEGASRNSRPSHACQTTRQNMRFGMIAGGDILDGIESRADRAHHKALKYNAPNVNSSKREGRHLIKTEA